jgi:RNA recognition motif-containing protein
MEVRLYVGNLSYNTSEDDLRELFGKAGAVRSVAIITDRETGRSKGFGFVEMGTQAEAQEAINQFNGSELHERVITVNLARPREDRGGGGGGGGGRGRSGGEGRRDDRGGGNRRRR